MLLGAARALLPLLHADRERPPGPVRQDDCERLRPLKGCVMHTCPDYDRKPNNDEEIVAACEYVAARRVRDASCR